MTGSTPVSLPFRLVFPFRRAFPFRLGIVLLVPLLAVAGFACGPGDDAANGSDPSPAVTEEGTASAASAAEESVVVVAEAWQSVSTPVDNIDSVAVWHGTDGGKPASWVLATAKETDRLVVYDALSGETLRAVGEEGTELGRFDRPNGVAVIDDPDHGAFVLVVERDNTRVQVMTLPGFEPVGAIGAGELERPYGLAAHREADGSWELWVTDDYETPTGEVPAPAQLGERLKRFRFELVAEEGSGEGAGSASKIRLVAEPAETFGETSGPGMLKVVESIAIDAPLGRLLVAEESEEETAIEIYGLDDGRWAGETLGLGTFAAQAEGIALVDCGGAEGFWIATDQDDLRTRFLIFDRATLELVGRFEGEVTANTDGITLTRQAMDGFPAGALFAVHDDQAVTAFGLAAVGEAVGVDLACGGASAP